MKKDGKSGKLVPTVDYAKKALEEQVFDDLMACPSPDVIQQLLSRGFDRAKDKDKTILMISTPLGTNGFYERMLANEMLKSKGQVLVISAGTKIDSGKAFKQVIFDEVINNNLGKIELDDGKQKKRSKETKEV